MKLLLYLLCIGSIYSSRTPLLLEETTDQTFALPLERSKGDIEDHFMELLGMEEPSVLSRRKRNDKVSNFMESLYNMMETGHNSVNERSQNYEDWLTADRILSMEPLETLPIDNNLYKLTFRLEDLLTEPNQEVTVAQLHIFLNSRKDKIEVSVYDETRKVVTQTVQPSEASIVFNVTQYIQKWMSRMTEPSIYVNLTNSYLHDAFVAVAFQDVHRQESRRVKRSADPPQPPAPERNDDSYDDSTVFSDGCRKQALYVSFEDLGWKSWVIAPSGYMAYFCGGGCSFPLHNRMNASNHAIVQNLAHMVHPSRAEATKCAPTQLTPLKILFIDNHKNVVMKKYRDMVVQECGCH